MGENRGGIRQKSPIRRVRSRGPDEPSPTGYWSNRYEVRCGALPTDGLVDRVLGLGLDSLVKEHRLELLFPVRGASAGITVTPYHLYYLRSLSDEIDVKSKVSP